MPFAALEITLLAPLSGVRRTLSDVPDPIFADGLAGRGWAIDPTNDTVHAPCAGEVMHLHRAGHAVLLRSEHGLDLLIHVGIDTVALGGAGFESLVRVGQKVEAGAPLLRFDLDAIACSARSLLTPVLVTNVDAIESIEDARTGLNIEAGRTALGIVRIKASTAATATTAGETCRSGALVIPNPAGLHARPAAALADKARRYRADVDLVRIDLDQGEHRASAKSVVGLMGLDLQQGSEVVVEARGVDARDAVDTLSALLREGCGEAIEAPESEPPAPIMPTSDTDRPPGSLGGVPAAPGIAIGNVVHWRVGIELPESDDPVDPAVERLRLEHALNSARAELTTLSHAHAHDSRGQILAAQAGMLDDPELLSAAHAAIVGGRTAGHAWLSAADDAAASLRKLKSAVMQERAIDLRDLGLRVARLLGGRSCQPTLHPGTLLIAEELTPSDVAGFDADDISGIACVTGGAAGHVAILARTLGIPTVCGMDAAVLRVAEGTHVLLDGDHGWLQPQPDAAAIDAARRRIDEHARRRALEQTFAQKEGRSKDGVRIEVVANVANLRDTDAAMQAGAEGVGLLRTEWLFDDRAQPPDEDEQTDCYGLLADRVGSERPLVIRTLDAGGDKPLAYLPMAREDNPFLGVRGVRVSFAHPELFRTQLRAILRTSGRARVHVMLPMVGLLEELRLARRMLEEEAASLEVATPPLGIMIEVPSAALMAEQFAREVDFFSIGSNDLTQYTLAMDRGHPALAKQADALHPAVLRLIAATCEAADRHERWVGVCGGVASDPLATPALVGLGVRELSVVPPAVATIKACVAGLDTNTCRGLVRELLLLDDAATVRARLRAFLSAD